MTQSMGERSIGNIGNYYGGLSVKRDEKGYWWSIEDYSGYDWEEIPEWLYLALVAFDDGLVDCHFHSSSDAGGAE